jgi:hypothetical protein
MTASLCSDVPPLRPLREMQALSLLEQMLSDEVAGSPSASALSTRT